MAELTNTPQDSILTSVKKLLLINEDYEAYDSDIIMHINTFLTVLYQVGVGKAGFFISDKSATWEEFLVDVAKFNAAKTYVYLRVRLLFDPPTSGTAVEAIKENIKELEWRLFVEADPPLNETSWGRSEDS